MSCSPFSIYTTPCRTMGGIQKFYVGTFNDSALIMGATADGSITSFSGTTVSFYGVEQRIEEGSVVEAGAGAGGNFNVTQTLEVRFNSITQAIQNQLAILGKGRWRVMFKDVQGNYFLVGKTRGVEVTATTGGSGKASGDTPGHTVTMVAKEPDYIVAVSSAAALSVIQE